MVGPSAGAGARHGPPAEQRGDRRRGGGPRAIASPRERCDACGSYRVIPRGRRERPHGRAAKCVESLAGASARSPAPCMDNGSRRRIMGVRQQTRILWRRSRRAAGWSGWRCWGGDAWRALAAGAPRRPARSDIAGAPLGVRAQADYSFEGHLGREAHVAGVGSAGIAMTVAPEDKGARSRSPTPGGGSRIHGPQLSRTWGWARQVRIRCRTSRCSSRRPAGGPALAWICIPRPGNLCDHRSPAVAAERPNVGRTGTRTP